MAPEFQTSSLLYASGAKHGFFGRNGGVSTGVFSSLNCSFNSGDSEADITENRSRVTKILDGHCLITNSQVHGNHVRIVGRETDSAFMEQADGLVTADTGVCIGALGADCAPVLFSAPGIIGVAHAGWKGAVEGITDAVIKTMEGLGASRDQIVAAIGPSIQVMSYEVGEDFRDKFLKASPIDAEDCFLSHSTTRNIHFDLPSYIERRLHQAGVQQIDKSENDTYEDEARFFSYRRTCHRGESAYGRQIGAICLSSRN